MLRRPVLWRYALVGLVVVIGGTAVLTELHTRLVFRALLILAIFLPCLAVATPRSYLAARQIRHGRAARALDLLLFNLVLLLLLAEIGLRIVGAASDSPVFASPILRSADRIARWRLPPGAPYRGFVVNDQGFYDEPFRPEKPDGTVRILGLADSFGIEAVRYEESWLTRLEAELARTTGGATDYEVMNLGVCQIGPREYLHLLREYLVPYRADFVVLGLFVGNDIVDLGERDPPLPFARREFWYLGFVPQRLHALARERARRTEPPDGTPNAPDGTAPPGGGTDTDAPPGRAPAPHAPGTPAWTADPEGTFSESAYLRFERERMNVTRARGTDPAVDRSYARLWEVLDAIRVESGGRLLLVLIPDEYQVNDALWARLHAPGAPEPEQWHRDRPQEELRAWAARRSVPVLDLLPILRHGSETEPLYHPRDSHWNPAGHARAARATAAALLPLLPEPAGAAP
jgi:hypothetical protein